MTPHSKECATQFDYWRECNCGAVDAVQYNPEEAPC